MHCTTVPNGSAFSFFSCHDIQNMVLFALNSGVFWSSWWPKKTGPGFWLPWALPCCLEDKTLKRGTNILACLQSIWKGLNILKNSKDDKWPYLLKKETYGTLSATEEGTKVCILEMFSTKMIKIPVLLFKVVLNV